jgi:hypothetical protein
LELVITIIIIEEMGQQQNKNICTFSLDDIEYSFEVTSDTKADLIKLLKDLHNLNPNSTYI